MWSCSSSSVVIPFFFSSRRRHTRLQGDWSSDVGSSDLYKPGSVKARLAVTGIRQMVEFCRENAVPHEICGKLVVAVDDTEVTRLRALHERGIANGLAGLRWMTRGEMRETEPH